MALNDISISELLLARDQVRKGGSSDLRRRATAGDVVRIRRGVYTGSTEWSDADDRARHLLRMQAAAETRSTRVVFSHLSAVLLWGIPIIGRWPPDVHLMAAGRSGMRSRNGIVWHLDRLADDDITSIGDMEVTSLARTLIDLAKTSRFGSAVTSLETIRVSG